MTSNADRVSALELHVAMNRLGGVVYPCLVCGGRGSSDPELPDPPPCHRCNSTGEEPAGLARDIAYPTTKGPVSPDRARRPRQQQ